MPLVMLRRDAAAPMRRRVPAGESEKTILFTPGEPQELTQAEIEALAPHIQQYCPKEPGRPLQLVELRDMPNGAKRFLPVEQAESEACPAEVEAAQQDTPAPAPAPEAKAPAKPKAKAAKAK